MKKLTYTIAALALLAASTPAMAVVRGSAGASKYSIGGGQCLYFQGVRYWIAAC